MEGGHCLTAATATPPVSCFPVAEYSHNQGCSITGGYVYRGTAIAGLAGTYFYSDFCQGTLASFRFDGAQALESKVWIETWAISVRWLLLDKTPPASSTSSPSTGRCANSSRVSPLIKDPPGREEIPRLASGF